MGAEAAIVGLIGAVIGIALTNGFAMLLEIKRRERRGMDLVYAIHAEIAAGLGANQKQLTAEEKAYALADQTPFQTPDDTDFVFASIKNDISLLPTQVIHSVVQYYRFALKTNLMISDLRHPVFEKQGPAKKQKFVASILDVADQQRLAGMEALEDLERFAASRNVSIMKRRN